jgi:Fur family ferric uptake transcriptional regulator
MKIVLIDMGANDNHSHGWGILEPMAKVENTWSELAHEALERSGQRAGGARRAVVDLLSQEDCCLSAQDIAARLRQEGGGVGTASVYRALDLLQGIGLVQRIEVGGGGARYERVIPDGEHHHHVVCESCGRISPFEDVGLERAIGRLAKRLGHRVSGHDVLIRGRCSRCEADAPSAAR